MMLTDGIRLLLFPALMAFAASSDLFTMTISNKLSLALAGGFLVLTLPCALWLALRRPGGDESGPRGNVRAMYGSMEVSEGHGKLKGCADGESVGVDGALP